MSGLKAEGESNRFHHVLQYPGTGRATAQSSDLRRSSTSSVLFQRCSSSQLSKDPPVRVLHCLADVP